MAMRLFCVNGVGSRMTFSATMSIKEAGRKPISSKAKRKRTNCAKYELQTIRHLNNMQTILTQQFTETKLFPPGDQ